MLLISRPLALVCSLPEVVLSVQSTSFEQKIGKLIQEGTPGNDEAQNQKDQTDAMTMASPGTTSYTKPPDEDHWPAGKSRNFEAHHVSSLR